MAFTQEERDKINQLLAEGKSTDEIASYIGGQRMGVPAEMLGDKPTAAERASAALAGDGYSLGETVGDIGGAVTGVIEAWDTRKDVAMEALGETRIPFFRPEGKQGIGETTAQVLSQGVLAAGDSVFELGLGAVKTLMPQSKEDKFAEEIASGMQEIMETPGAQAVQGWYDGLSDREKRNWSIPLALLEVVGVAKLKHVTKARRAADTTEDVVSKADEAAEVASEATNRTVRERLTSAVTDIPGVRGLRYNLSDIAPAERNAIARSTEENVKRHSQIARDAVEETGNKTNIEHVGELAEEAYGQISTKITTAREAKEAALREVGSQRLPDVPSGRTIDDVQRIVADRFGVTVNNKGFVEQLPGRVSTLGRADEKLLGEYVSKLRTLGPNPTVQQVDGFVDWAQRQLYKQTVSYSQLDAADKAIVAALKETTGTLNSRLKDSAVVQGTDYARANAEMSRLIPMADELSRGLGAEGRKGGAFVKRVFSPADARTKELFQQIYDETGINLTDEATLAKFFMEATGDTRQKTILRELVEVAEGTQQLDFTKPGTWLSWIRENADMDGEELALEILRRAREAEEVGDVAQGTTARLEQIATQQAAQAPTQTTATRQAVSSTNDTTPGLLTRARNFLFPEGVDTEGGFIKNPLVRDTLSDYKRSSPRGRNIEKEAQRALNSGVERTPDAVDARELIRSWLSGDSKITRAEVATAIDIIEGNATKSKL